MAGCSYDRTTSCRDTAGQGIHLSPFPRCAGRLAHSAHPRELFVPLTDNVSMHQEEYFAEKHTYDPAPVLLQFHRIWFNHDFDKDHTILVASADTFHETRSSHRLFIDQVCKLWDIDARRTRRECGKGKALSHCRCGWGVIWTDPSRSGAHSTTGYG